MTPHDLDILATVLPILRWLNRTCGPIPSRLLADCTGCKERTVRGWLRRLEMLGVVERPKGVRSGWCVAA